jgi:LysM repeat protein
MSSLIGNIVGAVSRDPRAKAHLEVMLPKNAPLSTIPFCFNPTELVFGKQTTFAEVPIPGLTSPPIQFVRGASEKLTFDAIVDTSDDMTDVNEKYVKPLRNLMNVHGSIHAPPVVVFVWNDFRFTGVVESLNVTFTLFSETGKPVRAKLALGLKEYTTVKEQRDLAQKQSPDVEKTYVVRRTDTLSSIAEQAYGDAAPWRQIARANGIADPRSLEPGTVLTIPRLVTEPT